MSKALAILALFLCAVSGTTWFISPFGNNNNDGTSPTSAFFDLETALDVAVKGDTIRAATGYYSGDANTYLSLDGITLIGAGNSFTVFQGISGSNRVDYIFHLDGNASVQSLTVSTAYSGIEVDSTCLIKDVICEDMTNYGVVMDTNSASVVLDSVKFTSCDIGVFAGSTATSLTDLSVTKCAFSTYYDAISFSYALPSFQTLNISSSTFSGVFGSSRGLYVSGSSSSAAALNILVSDSVVKDFDTSTSSGSGIYVTLSSASLIVSDSTFYNNSCSSGCGIYFLSENLMVLNSTFSDNQAISGSGGAMYYRAYESALISGCLFNSNMAGTTGGAIYISTSSSVTDTTYTIMDCVFQQNAASSNGGAFYSPSYAPVEISDCVFTSNYATSDGGAVYLQTSATLNNCSFIENTANTGGGIHSKASSSYPVQISNSLFVSNSVTEMGGAIFQDINGIVQLTVVNLVGNTAETGGAVYTAASFAFLSATIINNTATNGGGFYINNYPSSVNMKVVQLEGNAASSDGGGFYCDGGAGVFMSDVVISANTAGSGDGSAYYCSDCNVSSKNVKVDPDNTADCSL